MITIIPTATHIDLTVTLTSPLHHGAGSSGNTSLLRTHEVVIPGDQPTLTRVPYVSANSIRHGLREALAWHLAHTLGIQPGAWPKGVVDLLWSGGAVTTTGAQTDLEMMRRVDAHLPSLGLLGYAAQSDITAGTLRASDLILVCAENMWRLPDRLHTDRRAAAFRSEEFGTRHDIASTPVARFIDTAAQITGTTQMIYDTQVLKPGARLHGHLSLTPAATDGHRLALDAALSLWAPDGQVHLGARAAAGFGAATIDGLPDTAAALAQWTRHLLDHTDDIHTLLKDIIG